MQLVQAPGDLQNESADHLAEEQNHEGLNVRYRNSASCRHRICDPLEDFPAILIFEWFMGALLAFPERCFDSEF